ncbi:MAG: YqaA family protein, partial [Acidobacteriota bacterium]
MRRLRQLYDWVLHWAGTPHAALALFALAFAEASFFPIPPDVLLLAVCLAAPDRSLGFAARCTAGSVLGGMTGYGIGWGLWDALSAFFFRWIPGFSPAIYERVAGLYQAWDFWAVFAAGLTPIPYKVFTIAGGVFGVNFPVFVLASVLSRGLRFGAEGFLIYHFGPPVASFIDRYFNAMAVGFVVLLLAGFVLIRYV